MHPPLCRGTWRTQEFKDYNFNALGISPSGGHLHPLLKVCMRGACRLQYVCVGVWGAGGRRGNTGRVSEGGRKSEV